MSRAIKGAFLLLLVMLVGASGQAQDRNEGYKTVAPRAGERCLVCRAPLNETDLVLLVRGRRVPLKRAMVDSFMRDPDAFFSELQPKGALFHESPGAEGSEVSVETSSSWLTFGIYAVSALLFAGLSGYRAVSRGLPAVSHFFIGLLLHLPGYLYVLTRPAAAGQNRIPAGLGKVPETRPPVPCHGCGSENHPAARECSGCGKQLEPVYASDVSRLT